MSLWRRLTYRCTIEDQQYEWHQWGPWMDSYIVYADGTKASSQNRYCERCHKSQIEERA